MIRLSVRSILLCCFAACASGAPPASPPASAPSPVPLRILVWSEGTAPKNIYPADINTAVAEGLRAADPALAVLTASLADPEQGLSEATLAEADVLVWWGHLRHADVSDAAADRVVRHVRERGLGFIVLHSAIHARPFRALMGTPCDIRGWREDSQPVQVHVVAPGHPIASGLGPVFTIPADEMYAEPFIVPPPDELVFISTYSKGEAFRSGCCWRRGNGRVFFLQAGHESDPVYFDPNVRRVIGNAVRWAAGK